MNIVGSIDGKPVYWADTNSQPQTLSLAGFPSGFACGINSLRQIVGGIQTDDFIQQPFYWADPNSQPQKLSLAGNKSGTAVGIDTLGQIVGNITSSTAQEIPVFWSDFNSQPQKLSLGEYKIGRVYGINSLGQSVGLLGDDPSRGGENVVWPNTTVQPQPLSVPSKVIFTSQGINSLGQIVGSLGDAAETKKAGFWPNSTAIPQPLSGNRGYATSINSLGQIVGQIDGGFGLSGGTPVFWANSTALPQPLLGGKGIAFGIADTATPVISNICFPAGTPITTDQGRIAIEAIDPQVHTIHHQPILHVTRTVTLDKYLISLAPHALGRNVPHTKTLLSKDHKIAFEGQLVPAYRFLDYSDQVKKVTYKGETLYNILLPGYSTMLINNLECETLHPENIIAKLYTASYTDTERAILVQQWNASLTQRDNSAYQAVVNRLTTHS